MLPYRPWPPGAQPAPVISMAADGAHIDVAALLAGLTNDLLPPLPADNPLLEPPDRMRSPTPEPLEEQDLVAMRARALAMKESPGNGKGKGREDTIEQELLQMVLALTAAPTAQSQLLDQATTISRLLKQQDFLINRMDNDRALWETEKESMQRVAEALLTQVNAGHSYVPDENHAHPLLLESEISLLRKKLVDSQSRMISLESELQRLRPILLMTPQALASAKGIVLPQYPSNRLRHIKKERETDRETIGADYYPRISTDEKEKDKEKKSMLSSSKRSSSGKPSKAHKRQRTAYFRRAPISADARAEHLLLAARRLGRERASLLGEAMYQLVDGSGAAVSAVYRGPGMRQGAFAMPFYIPSPGPGPAKNTTKMGPKMGPGTEVVPQAPWPQGIWGALPPGAHPAHPHPHPHLAYGGSPAPPGFSPGVQKRVSFQQQHQPGRKFILHPSSGSPSRAQAQQTQPSSQESSTATTVPTPSDANNPDSEMLLEDTDEPATTKSSIQRSPSTSAPASKHETSRPPVQHHPSPSPSHFPHAPAYVPHPGWPYYPYVYGQPIPFPPPSPSANHGTSQSGPDAKAPMQSTSTNVPSASSTTHVFSISGDAAPASAGRANGNANTRQPQGAVGAEEVHRQQNTPQRQPRAPTRGTPSAMDNLISAALSEFAGSPAGSGVRGSTDASPLAKKRRRVSRVGAGDGATRASEEAEAAAAANEASQLQTRSRTQGVLQGAGSSSGTGLARQASGLDVLADQAIGPGAMRARTRRGSMASASTSAASKSVADSQPTDVSTASATTGLGRPTRKRGRTSAATTSTAPELESAELGPGPSTSARRSGRNAGRAVRSKAAQQPQPQPSMPAQAKSVRPRPRARARQKPNADESPAHAEDKGGPGALDPGRNAESKDQEHADPGEIRGEERMLSDSLHTVSAQVAIAAGSFRLRPVSFSEESADGRRNGVEVNTDEATGALDEGVQGEGGDGGETVVAEDENADSDGDGDGETDEEGEYGQLEDDQPQGKGQVPRTVQSQNPSQVIADAEDPVSKRWREILSQRGK